MVQSQLIALFGESERGEFRRPYLCRNLQELDENLGNPPPHSIGLYYAIQLLLFQNALLFMRVQEEGFSVPDYLQGMKVIKSLPVEVQPNAICAPGVGDNEIIDAIIPFCISHHNILITREADLYDYLTQ